MPRNPYQYLRPVSPDAFVGRWRLVHEIADDLSLEGGESHAIVAGRRCSVFVPLSVRSRPGNGYASPGGSPASWCRASHWRCCWWL